MCTGVFPFEELAHRRQGVEHKTKWGWALMVERECLGGGGGGEGLGDKVGFEEGLERVE